jgi:hypothetical protein
VPTKLPSIVKVLAAFLLPLTISASAFATTYYIDSQLGRDFHNGLTQLTQWNNITKVFNASGAAETCTVQARPLLQQKRHYSAGTLVFTLDSGSLITINTNVTTNPLEARAIIASDAIAQKSVTPDYFAFKIRGLGR